MDLAEVRQLPLADKLQLMDVLWEDLSAHAEQLPVPAWHRAVLEERRQAVAEGRLAVLDWDEVKARLATCFLLNLAN